MSSSKRRKVFSFQDVQAVAQENAQLRQKFALQCQQLADTVEKLSTLPASRQQPILSGLASRDFSIFLVTSMGLVGVDALRMALHLIPRAFPDYYKPVAAVISSVIDRPMSCEDTEMVHAVIKKKLSSFLDRDGTSGSYREDLVRVTQVCPGLHIR